MSNAGTYSLSQAGCGAHNPWEPVALTCDDSIGVVGGQQQAMRLGTPVLCKGLDGQQNWYVMETDRSAAGTTLVMRKYR